MCERKRKWVYVTSVGVTCVGVSVRVECQSRCGVGVGVTWGAKRGSVVLEQRFECWVLGAHGTACVQGGYNIKVQKGEVGDVN